MKDLIIQKEIDFFPVDKSLSIKNNNEKNDDTMEYKLNELSENFKTLSNNIEEIKKALEKHN